MAGEPWEPGRGQLGPPRGPLRGVACWPRSLRLTAVRTMRWQVAIVLSCPVFQILLQQTYETNQYKNYPFD